MSASTIACIATSETSCFQPFDFGLASTTTGAPPPARGSARLDPAGCGCPMTVKATLPMLRSLVGDDAAPDPLGDLRDEGIAEGAQSVHPSGNPISHSAHGGFTPPPPPLSAGSSGERPALISASITSACR